MSVSASLAPIHFLSELHLLSCRSLGRDIPKCELDVCASPVTRGQGRRGRSR